MFNRENMSLTEQERMLFKETNRLPINTLAQNIPPLDMFSPVNSRLQIDKINSFNSIQIEKDNYFKSEQNQNSKEENNVSQIESAILKSSEPIDLNEIEEIMVNGEKGVWANKAESLNWRGTLPLSEYKINEDENPQIIRKKNRQNLVYHQEVAIRYLRPPTPPPPGPIIIQQEADLSLPPAPPLVIRQQPPKPPTPPPLVIREAPPSPPVQIGKKKLKKILLNLTKKLNKYYYFKFLFIYLRFFYLKKEKK